MQKKSKLYRILLVGTPFSYPFYYLYLMIQDLSNNSPSNCLLNYNDKVTTITPFVCVISTLFCYLIILLKVIFGKDPIGNLFIKILGKYLCLNGYGTLGSVSVNRRY
ncbi:unnamed protein product [Meloidogyne enterolobii]|uniref:Uncharacterized protein n=1 Tax=Meloidogyne enterolobii TaxID=390850 RepID=A0ACB0ZVB0_MELEN